MFIELHLYDSDQKIIININRIISIQSTVAYTWIDVDGKVLRIKESYEDIAKFIDKYYKS